MNIGQLKQLVAVSRTGTLSGAAANVGLSQSALSRSMQRLEQELGAHLFERTGNSVRLNRQGRLASFYAVRILAAYDKLHESFPAVPLSAEADANASSPLARIEFDQFTQLESIARLGTISAASRELYIAQPSITRSMHRLEHCVGEQLFDRTPNTITLNARGYIAVQHARELLALQQEMFDAFRPQTEGWRTLQVASCSHLPLWRLNDLVMRSFPELALQSHLDEVPAITEGVRNGTLDAGLVPATAAAAAPDLDAAPVCTEDLALLAPTSHPLAQQETVSFEDLSRMAFAVYASDHHWINVLHQRITGANIAEIADLRTLTQLLHYTDRLGFSGSLCGETQPERRVSVPIADAQAHAHFVFINRPQASPYIQQLSTLLQS